MTPKEKAIKLISKFKNRSIELGESHSELLAEANALIAVNEILSMKIIRKDELLDDYWEEVKQEIEKL